MTINGLLDDPALIAERSAALGKPHIAPLEIWREGLVGAGHPVPHFDPFDAGIAARLLLLLETPGPGPELTRFVSRDNPSGTARNLRRYLEAADIDRNDIVQWNCVPWIVHSPGARNRALRRAEIAEGIATLPGLLAKLPGVRVCILAGRVAAGAEALIKEARPDVSIITMPHPSPANVCTSPDVGERIASALAAAKNVLIE